MNDVPVFVEEDFSPVGRYSVVLAAQGDERPQVIEVTAASPHQACRAFEKAGRVLAVTPVIFDAAEFWEHQRVFTKAEAARFCRLESESEINRAITAGKLAKGNGAAQRFNRAELQEWLETRRTAGTIHHPMSEAA